MPDARDRRPTRPPAAPRLAGGLTPRRAALLAAALLGAALGTALLVATPWDPLASTGAEAVALDVAGDFRVEEAERADAYRGAVRPPAYLSLALGLAVALALGLTPLGARLVAAAARPAGGGWWARLVLGTVAVTLVVRLVRLPLDARVEALARAYGLSTRSWGEWLLDVARGWFVLTAGLLVALAVLLALVRRLPRWWWAPGAASAAGIVLAASFLYPVVVEPLFHRFTPMAQGQQRADLVALAERAGLEVEEVLVADASRRTTALNAYVSGFGPTRRIVVYDTLLEEATPAEVRSIVAHEIGHAMERDVLSGTVLGALGAAGAVCLLGAVLPASTLLRRAGVASPADPRVVALLLALVTLGTTVTGPVQALVSRRVEARADVHALSLTRDPQTFVRMQRRLALTNLSDLTPPPVSFGLFATHPSAPMRMGLARSWARAHGVRPPGPLLTGDAPADP